MKKLLIRELGEEIGNERTAVLSITALSPNISLDLFDSELSKFLSGNTTFERVHVVGFKSEVEKLRVWLGIESEPGKRLRRVLTNLDIATNFICFEQQQGVFRASNFQGLTLSNTSEIVSAERRASLLDAFNRAGGMLETPRGFHYKKTSGSHSLRFIKTSNVLESGENVCLVSIWLLPLLWSADLEEVIVDTSGIFAPVLNAVHLRAKLKGESTVLKVWSHQSFMGLNDMDVIEGTQSLCLISASSSGTLRNRLIANGAAPANVWTIFGLAPQGKVLGNTLCDLLGRPYMAREGYDLIENEKEATCKYCKGGSLAVRISGDQFVLEPPKVAEVDILGTDILPDAKVQLSEFVGTGLFKAYRVRPGRRGGVFDLYLDVQSLLAYIQNTPSDQVSEYLKKFQRSWSTLQARASTLNVERVVYTSYPFSEELAHQIADAYPVRSAMSAPKVMSQRELIGESGSTGSGTIVVAACVDDHQELMSIGRDLRNVQESGTTWFISPMVRSSSAEMPEKIRRIVGFGEFGPGTFSAHHCLNITFPDDDGHTSWDVELQIIRELNDSAIQNAEVIPAEIKAREELLMRGASTGLGTSLFWPSPTGDQLSLRKDFSLLTTSRHLSQGDVFAVISIALHRLRIGVGSDRRLLYTPYARSVVAPGVFGKFNDAVVQAAILRAARGHELQYSNCDEATSDSMLQILKREIDEINSGGGEALLEFVLAMLAGRMSLHKSHLSMFCEEVLKVTTSPVLNLAARFLRQAALD